MKRPSTTAPRPPMPLDPAKEQRLRRWACKIASELPSSSYDALLVLKYAERLIDWADHDEEPTRSTKRGRAVR